MKVLGVVACLLAAGATSASTAHVASGRSEVSQLHLVDPAGDSWGDRSHEQGPNSDLVAVDIERGPDELVLRLTYTDLTWRASTQWGIYFEIPRARDDLSFSWEQSRTVDTHEWDTTASLVAANENDGLRVACPTPEIRVDTRAETLTVRLSATCYRDRRSIVVTDLHAYARGAGNGYDITDTPFGDGDESIYGTRTQRLQDPA